MSDRLFMLFPDGRVEEVLDDGDTVDFDREPSLYDDLVKAGYPLHHDRLGGSSFDNIIDLRVVEPDRVIVYTTGPEPREHDMGPAAGLFLAWLRRVEGGDR